MGDKETELSDLNTTLTKEDEDIVDSIINELNEGSDSPPQMSPQDRQRMEQQRMEQQRMMQQQQMAQQQMAQQQMAQKQMMQQQQMAQKQMMEQSNKEETKEKEEEKKEESIIDKLKVDLKDPLIVSVITFILLMPQSDSLVTMIKLELFLNVDGSLSIYGYLVKAVIAGLLYYLFTKYS